MHKQIKINFFRNSRNLFFVVLFLMFVNLVYSQCAMCRASLEGEGNVAKAKAVNDGIVYLMVIPYLLAALIAFAVYKMYKSKK